MGGSMTTYLTGNPVGSADPRDLYDNAQVIDDYANSEAETTTDRLGVERRTISGLDAYVEQVVTSAGYEFIGDYAAGIELIAYNQVVREAGEFWRVSGAIDLPYTTTGAGMPEGGAFVSVGDAALREELVAHEESTGDVHGIPAGERALHTGESGGGTPIGGYVAVQTSLTGAEEPDPNTHIKLTAGEDGIGGYNEGKLSGETITGTAPLLEATAEIADSESPLFGQTIRLLNTERRYVAPGEAAGAVANDVMQQITGIAGNARDSDFNDVSLAWQSNFSGALYRTGDSIGRTFTSTATTGATPRLGFDSANSPDARTSDHTDVKHVEATYYMRVK